MIKTINFNGLKYYHTTVYLKEKGFTKQYINNLIHGKKYQKKYISKEGEKKVYNYVAAPKFKKGKDYIVRDKHIYISESKFPEGFTGIDSLEKSDE